MPGLDLSSFIGGFLAAIGSKIFLDKYNEPKLEVDDKIIPVISTAVLQVLEKTENGVIKEANQKVRVYVYRVKVRNKGRTAAKNVCGTIEFNENQPERRICWYEGNVPSLNINKGDHSFLDIYGVIMEGNRFTKNICMPTENGWEGLQKIPINQDLLTIRITAENAIEKKRKFKIDLNNNCEMKFI